MILQFKSWIYFLSQSNLIRYNYNKNFYNASFVPKYVITSVGEESSFFISWCMKRLDFNLLFYKRKENFTEFCRSVNHVSCNASGEADIVLVFHEKINRDEAAKLLLSQKIDTYTWPDTWFIRHDKISLD